MENFIKATCLCFCLSLIAIGCDKESLSQPSFDPNAQQEAYRRTHDSMKIVLRNSIINNLHGEWLIDSLEIDFQKNYYHEQAGISGDTTFLDFGEIAFGDWNLIQMDNDSTNFYNNCILTFKGEEYRISFDYLFYVTGLNAVYSYSNKRIESPSDWSHDDARFLTHIGILDNVQIQKIKEDEFKLIGLNKGVKNMKLRRK